MNAAAGRRWKYLFFSLLAVNVLFFLAVAWLVLDNEMPGEEHPRQGGSGETASGLKITATKDELNQLLGGYLKSNAAGDGPRFSLLLDEDVRLAGAIQAFGRQFQLELRFDPVVTDNGDLVLEAGSMRIGALPLPVKRALSLIEGHVAVPEWVEIAPEEKRVYVLFSRIALRGGLKVKVTAFNPPADQFEFVLYLPDAH